MTEPEGLWTTQVGSLPKPPEILAARAGLAKGRISREELRAKERKATEDWVRFQDDLGMDVVVDGEQYRGDMVAFFAEELEGFARGGLVLGRGAGAAAHPPGGGRYHRVFPQGDPHVMSSAPGMGGQPDPGLYRTASRTRFPICLALQGGAPSPALRSGWSDCRHRRAVLNHL